MRKPCREQLRSDREHGWRTLLSDWIVATHVAEERQSIYQGHHDDQIVVDGAGVRLICGACARWQRSGSNTPHRCAKQLWRRNSDKGEGEQLDTRENMPEQVL